MMAAEHNKNRRILRTAGIGVDGSEPIATSSSASSDDDLFAKLPDELTVEIFSRLGTVNEAARCSALCKRFGDTWRLIDGGVLDLDKSGELPPPPRSEKTFRGERGRFVDLVDQALSRFLHKNLDGLRIGFDLLGMEDKIQRWIEFGLTKRVKELTVSHGETRTGHPNSLPGPVLNKFLFEHDLSRLGVLELEGLWPMSQRVVERFFSNCPSLQRFALRRCSLEVSNSESRVVRVCASNKLQSLSFHHVSGLQSIEIVSAPCLRTLELRGERHDLQAGVEDDLPKLEEAHLCFGGWSPFSRFAPGLQRLVLELDGNESLPPLAPTPEWLLFGKLKVLDLFIFTVKVPQSLLDCRVLLMAAPVLRHLSIWFKHCFPVKAQGTQNFAAKSRWKRHSLEILELHGVSSEDDNVFGRGVQLKLAAYIIGKAPFLKQVLIETKLPHQIDVRGREAKSMSLETLLPSCRPASSQINFTYRY